MKITEIQAVLARVSQIVGDAPAILKSAESEVETEIKGVEILLRADGAAEGNVVSLIHGAVTPAATLPAGTISPEPSE
jgi:hypothetical protein